MRCCLGVSCFFSCSFYFAFCCNKGKYIVDFCSHGASIINIENSVSCKNGMSTETKLHSYVKPRYHNEDNPGDKG